jgi:hypothetical protein
MNTTRANSDGWIVNPPARSQRREPFTVQPATRTTPRITIVPKVSGTTKRRHQW